MKVRSRVGGILLRPLYAEGSWGEAGHSLIILGIIPLALSTAAGAASRHSIGTGVLGGMLGATFITVLFIPSFYVIDQP